MESLLIEGVRDLLGYLKEKNIPIGILTRNSQKIAILTLEKFDLEFDIILSRDTARAKPDPHGLEIMAKAWGINTESMAFFGDSSFDTETARNANSLAILYSPEPSLSETISSDSILTVACYKELLNSL
jgi:HAD superfamily hydrolase (TIGR01549 family)